MTVYTFEDSQRVESTFTTIDAIEAKRFAEQNGLAAIANEYEWTDSEIAWDYRPSDIEEVPA